MHAVNELDGRAQWRLAGNLGNVELLLSAVLMLLLKAVHGIAVVNRAIVVAVRLEVTLLIKILVLKAMRRGQ